MEEVKERVTEYLLRKWSYNNHPNHGKKISEMRISPGNDVFNIRYKVEGIYGQYVTDIVHIDEYAEYTIPTVEFATAKFRNGIEQGIYGPVFRKTMLRYDPTIIEINLSKILFGMWKHHGILVAGMTEEIRNHWGICKLQG